MKWSVVDGAALIGEAGYQRLCDLDRRGRSGQTLTPEELEELARLHEELDALVFKQMKSDAPADAHDAERLQLLRARHGGELPSSAPENISRCASCGFTWETGLDGSHSCVVVLQGRVQGLLLVVEEVIEAWRGDSGLPLARLESELGRGWPL